MCLEVSGRGGYNSLHNYAVVPWLFFVFIPAVDDDRAQLWSGRGGGTRLTVQMWTWRRSRILTLFMFPKKKNNIRSENSNCFEALHLKASSRQTERLNENCQYIFFGVLIYLFGTVTNPFPVHARTKTFCFT